MTSQILVEISMCDPLIYKTAAGALNISRSKRSRTLVFVRKKKPGMARACVFFVLVALVALASSRSFTSASVVVPAGMDVTLSSPCIPAAPAPAPSNDYSTVSPAAPSNEFASSFVYRASRRGLASAASSVYAPASAPYASTVSPASKEFSSSSVVYHASRSAPASSVYAPASGSPTENEFASSSFVYRASRRALESAPSTPASAPCASTVSPAPAPVPAEEFTSTVLPASYASSVYHYSSSKVSPAPAEEFASTVSPASYASSVYHSSSPAPASAPAEEFASTVSPASYSSSVYHSSSNFSPAPAPGYTSIVLYPAKNCSVRFWLHNTNQWPAKSGIKPESSLMEVFGGITGHIIGHYYPSSMTFVEALRAHGAKTPYAPLIRQAAAALLNSYDRPSFPYTPQLVKERLASSIGNRLHASQQAVAFARANAAKASTHRGEFCV